jgi:hypothetical protein
VSENIIEASWLALVDAVEYKLLLDEGKLHPSSEQRIESRTVAAGN